MASVQDQVAFNREEGVARDQHQQALTQAASAFDAAQQEAQAKWTARVVAARAAFEEVKGEPEREDYDSIRRELEAATGTAPDIEEARWLLSLDVAEADKAFNEAINAARQKMLTPSNPRARG
jgi:hypothetical protein